jgi:hypothetical protein
MPTETLPRPNRKIGTPTGSFRLSSSLVPGDEDPVKARQKINLFFAARIRHFGDLTECGELVPYDAILSEEARNSGIKATYQRFPIPDINVPFDRARMKIGQLNLSCLEITKQARQKHGIGFENRFHVALHSAPIVPSFTANFACA